MKPSSRNVSQKGPFAANGGRLQFGESVNHLGQSADQQRFAHTSPTPQNPCFIHSHLDNVLESSRKEHSYFDSLGSTVSESHQQNNTLRQSANSAQGSRGGDKNRPEPRHRGAQGATEPESDDSESDASTDKNDGSASYSPSESEDSQDESDRVRSLTRQLAETAVGVREMSKQLGESTLTLPGNDFFINICSCARSCES